MSHFFTSPGFRLTLFGALVQLLSPLALRWSPVLCLAGLVISLVGLALCARVPSPSPGFSLTLAGVLIQIIAPLALGWSPILLSAGMGMSYVGLVLLAATRNRSRAWFVSVLVVLGGLHWITRGIWRFMTLLDQAVGITWIVPILGLFILDLQIEPAAFPKVEAYLSESISRWRRVMPVQEAGASSPQWKRNRAYLALGWILFLLSPLVANRIIDVRPSFWGFVTGIVGAVLIARAKPRSIARTVVLVITLSGLCLLTSMFINNFLVYNQTARQSEAKTNLSALYHQEKAFHEKHKRYGTFEEIGFRFGGAPPRTTCDLCRYTYRIDQSGAPGTIIVGRTYGEEVITVVQAGISQDGQHFTATATGNVDSDPTIDQWHINDQGQGLQRADVNDAPTGWEWVLTVLTNSKDR